MTPFYTDDWLTIFEGDCRTVLAELPSDSVDCVVTSPPYWGLRDYGTATWSGGDEACDHRGRTQPDSGPVNGFQPPVTRGGALRDKPRTDCKCGAVRQDSQLGLERTPEEYVTNLVAVFAEVRRVLKPSGTCWLNLGDTFAANRSYQVTDTKWTDVGNSKGSSVPSGLKPKDLVGIPWRVAFALQADGWYLRSDIIWSKPNPMPESVTDRPTKSHEYLFLLTKSPRYYFDADAVRESPSDNSHGALIGDPGHKARTTGNHSGPLGLVAGAAGRNIRSVWNIATRPYPGAHFAVFPPELPERCIKAGSPEGGLVLDPFAGSGTVGLVANRLSRRAILIDLNPEYLKQQMKRNAQTPLGLTEGDAA